MSASDFFSPSLSPVRHSELVSEEFTVIILAGGKSSRMGREKGFVEINGKRMMDRIEEVTRNLGTERILVTNSRNFSDLGIRTVTDVTESCGPAAGIYSGLRESKTRKNLVVAYDNPFLSHELLNFLTEKSGDEDVIVPVHNGLIEPLCAVYDKSCEKKILERINSGVVKMQEIIRNLNSEFIDVQKEFPGYSEELFININYPHQISKPW